jgi:hypothetical protein
MKLKVLVILFVLASSLGFAQKSIMDQNGYDFFKWTEEQKSFYVSGFCLGAYAAAYLAAQDGYENAGKLLVPGAGVKMLIIIRETEEWYQRVGPLSTPIYIAIYRRNLPY